MATTRSLSTARLTAGTVVLASVLAAVTVVAPASASAPGGTIAFVSERTGNDEIYVMDSAGGNVTQLTDSPGFDRAPGWSPDGTHLVFNSRREPHPDRPQIYTLDLATGEQVRVTDSPIEEQRATWSGDGASLYFHRGAFFAEAYNLVEHSLGTGTERILTDSVNPAIWNAAPAPRPDGSVLLFQSNRDDPTSVFPQRLQLLDLATLAVTSLALPASLPADTSIDGPRWSADGTHFTFSASTDNGNQLFVVDATGAPAGWVATPVTDGLSEDSAPAFSPDGTHLVFQTYREGADPDGAEDTTVIRTLDLGSGEITEIGEGRTPVWTATDWVTPAASEPQLAATGMSTTQLVPAVLLAIGGIALLLSRRVGPQRR